MTCIRSHPHSNNPSEVTILGGKYEKFREIIDCLKVHAPIQPVQVHFCLNDDKAAEQKTQDRERGSVVPEIQQAITMLVRWEWHDNIITLLIDDDNILHLNRPLCILSSCHGLTRMRQQTYLTASSL